MLAQFALLGSTYAEVRGIPQPRVGLLTNGKEHSKGTDQIRAVHDLLTDAPINYVGKVEGRDIFGVGDIEVDVVVADGHLGNVVLKSIEGAAMMMGGFVLGSFFTSKEAEAAYEVMRGPLRPLKTSLDPAAIGGVPLLGAKGICIVGHGSSTAGAVTAGIRAASTAMSAGLTNRFRDAISQLKGTDTSAED
jgi:glycerol-3-phosphate acyltransferase PlsX